MGTAEHRRQREGHAASHLLRLENPRPAGTGAVSSTCSPGDSRGAAPAAPAEGVSAQLVQ